MPKEDFEYEKGDGEQIKIHSVPSDEREAKNIKSIVEKAIKQSKDAMSVLREISRPTSRIAAAAITASARPGRTERILLTSSARISRKVFSGSLRSRGAAFRRARTHNIRISLAWRRDSFAICLTVSAQSGMTSAILSRIETQSAASSSTNKSTPGLTCVRKAGGSLRPATTKIRDRLFWRSRRKRRTSSPSRIWISSTKRK